ncbi:MAG: FGGY-family carbohydrate kinase, partial [Mariniphaga sp.]
SVTQNDEELKIAKKLLFTPDALNYLFTGVMKNEYTIASTSQMLKPGKAEWEFRLFDVAGIDRELGAEIIPPGTLLGNILPEIQEETGCGSIPCVAVASHDTASAVVSVPAGEGNWAFISSGTWSLLGIESTNPIISTKTMEMNFTNEGGVESTTRFLKNIMGMWLIQECKRIWDQEKGAELTWREIVDQSMKVKPFQCFINPDDSVFLNPGNMPEAIQEFCRKTKQHVPENIGEIARCIYESLVLKYKHTLLQIESVTGERIEKLHIIGGGAHNEMLNQFTANATGIEIVAGPTEATAIGNILMQAKAVGAVGSLSEIREVVRNSFDVNSFYPEFNAGWEKAYEKFSMLL